MSTLIEVPRSRLYGMWVVMAALAIALFIILFVLRTKPPAAPTEAGGLVQDAVDVPISADLRKFLQDKQYSVLMLLNAEGRVKVVNPLGKDVEPVCTINGTEVPEACGTNASLITNYNAVEISISTASPACTKIKVQGKLIKVHADGPYAGFDPCHEGGPGAHGL